MDIFVKTEGVMQRSELVAQAQLVEYTGIDDQGLTVLLELGWVEPVTTRAAQRLFRLRDVYRIGKLLRLCRDLEISMTGGTIIVDLLERIEALENKLRELKRLA